MNWFPFFILLVGLSWAAVGVFRWYAIDKGWLDQPNARSSHVAPTPRGGGIVFFLGWSVLAGILHYFEVISQSTLLLFMPVALFGLLGFWDDHKNLSAGLRFFIQCVLAALSLMILNESGAEIQSLIPYQLPLPACFILMVFGYVWVVNLYNFMDGSDGIAATQGIFIFSIGGFILFQQEGIELGVLAWGLVAILAGFLTWNWPTARIFMGDSGSYFLGSLVCIYALAAKQYFEVPLMLWVILTSVFWFDATITLVRRILAGQDWHKPHRSHAYQRMIQSGWSHQSVLLCIIGINVILSSLTLIAYFDPRLIWFSLLAALILLSCIYILVEIAKPMHKTWHK